MKAKPRPAATNGEDPVVAFAAIDALDLGAVAGEDITRDVHLLAIDAIE